MPAVRAAGQDTIEIVTRSGVHAFAVELATNAAERAVGLMWKDDLDTAFRHLELYDRFGCPGEHVQISFRCVVRQGNIDQKDPKATDAFNKLVDDCWKNPALQPPPPPPPTASAEKPGTK